MKIELDIEIPEEFEATGEFRNPKDGDWFIDLTGESRRWHSRTNCPNNRRIILRKKTPEYRTLTNQHSEPYVEIKALEDALRIINLMEMNPNDSTYDLGFGDLYQALKELVR